MKKLLKILYLRLEGIGLFMLLISFGWQCLEEDSSSTKIEGYFFELNEKIDAIWSSALNEYVWSDRNRNNNGDVEIYGTYFNYKNTYSSWKDWNKVKESLDLVNKQEKNAKNIRITLYIMGSICILLPKFILKTKWPLKENNGKGQIPNL